jgi:hypothetical protein
MLRLPGFFTSAKALDDRYFSVAKFFVDWTASLLIILLISRTVLLTDDKADFGERNQASINASSSRRSTPSRNQTPLYRIALTG